MTSKEVARLIDISAVRTHHTLSDIKEVVAYAKEYRFINVHSLPCWTKTVNELLKDDPDIYTGAPVGFPGGGHSTETKVFEAKQLIADGVDEMDIVMNIGRLKNCEDAFVLDELKQVISLAPKNVITKIIIEINCLTDEEMDRACRICMETSAAFVKTGTGWVPGDANVKRIARIKELTQGKMMVKAAGGIRAKEEFDMLLELGVERFGINTKSAIDIVRSFE